MLCERRVVCSVKDMEMECERASRRQSRCGWVGGGDVPLPHTFWVPLPTVGQSRENKCRGEDIVTRGTPRRRAWSQRRPSAIVAPAISTVTTVVWNFSQPSARWSSHPKPQSPSPHRHPPSPLSSSLLSLSLSLSSFLFKMASTADTSQLPEKPSTSSASKPLRASAPSFTPPSSTPKPRANEGVKPTPTPPHHRRREYGRNEPSRSQGAFVHSPSQC